MPPLGHFPRTVAPSGAVAITAARCGGLGAVTQTLLAGFGCALSGLDYGEVGATGQQVNSPSTGPSPSPYIVNAPSKEGVYSSPGMLRGSERKDTPAGDASWGRVTVQQPSDPGPCEPPEQLAHLPFGGGERLRAFGCTQPAPHLAGNPRGLERRPHLRRQHL